MQIIKILVDKLPTSCLECSFVHCSLPYTCNTCNDVVKKAYHLKRHPECLLEEEKVGGHTKADIVHTRTDVLGYPYVEEKACKGAEIWCADCMYLKRDQAKHPCRACACISEHTGKIYWARKTAFGLPKGEYQCWACGWMFEAESKTACPVCRSENTWNERWIEEGGERSD